LLLSIHRGPVFWKMEKVPRTACLKFGKKKKGFEEVFDEFFYGGFPRRARGRGMGVLITGVRSILSPFQKTAKGERRGRV